MTEFQKEVRKTFGEVISAMGALQDENVRLLAALKSMAEELVQHRAVLAAFAQSMSGGGGAAPTEIEATEPGPRQRAQRMPTAVEGDESEDAWAARRAASAARVQGMATGPAPAAPAPGPAPVPTGVEMKSPTGHKQVVSFVPGPAAGAPAAAPNGQSA